MAKIKAPVQKNEIVTLDIQDLSYQGLGVGKIDQYTIFVDDALTGETVEARINKVTSHFAFGSTINRLTTSPDRAEIRDKAYTQTGISPLQHLAYPAQLKFKQQQIKNLYEKANLNIEVKPTIGMHDPLGYRNKAIVPVKLVDDVIQTGFFRQRSHDLLPIENFLIQDPQIDAAIIVVRDALRRNHVKPYDETTGTGSIRNIMVRRGYYSHEMMIVLVSRTEKINELDKIVHQIQQKVPEAVSIMVNINPKNTNVVLGDEMRLLWGQDHISDTLLDLTFEISAESFYQVNPTQAERLYEKALEVADIQPTDIAIDAYSGIGTISLALARQAKQVYGVEIVPQAVEDAKHNAEINGISNVEFFADKAEDYMQKLATEDKTIDLLTVDPPRKGLAPEFIDAVGKLKPKKMVYISCNPATLARDIKLLEEFGYEAHETQPVDMFPMTTHIESVTRLTLK